MIANLNLARFRHDYREMHVVAIQTKVLGRYQAAVLPQYRVEYDRKGLDLIRRILHANQVIKHDLVGLRRKNVIVRHHGQMVKAPIRKPQQKRNRLIFSVRVFVVHEAKVVDSARRTVLVVVELVPHRDRLQSGYFDFDLLAVLVDYIRVDVADRVQAQVVEALLGAPVSIVALGKLEERAHLVMAFD